MAEKKYWWNDKSDIGSYNFCFGGIWDYDFYIEEVDVKYDMLTAEERQRRFKGAKFIWGGCTGGWASSDNPLKADTIEEAKKEFEAWCEQYLAGRIEGLKKALATAEEEFDSFRQYRKGD